jgi:FkbM family methyltransferase
MIFVSFAQSQEDVMLYRALRDVKQGFYIDVGAQDPVIDSVTKVFYDRGWRGINIEPSAEYLQKLQTERPHDTNLAIAVGREAGVIRFYEVANSGLSTTNAGYAERHLEAGYEVQPREVPCTTLDRICAENGVGTVHFLKIDVEGAEGEVLEGCSFETLRPWLVVVDATEPNSDRENFADWEELLLRRRYRFVYFDGLNRFYAAEEHADLARHFSRPPNFFDQYITYQLWCTRADLEAALAAERNALIKSLDHMLVEVQSARAESQTYRAESVRLQEATAELQRELISLVEIAAERDLRLMQQDRHLASLQEVVAQRERQLSSLQNTTAASLAKAQQRLESLRSSISWKLTSPLREIRRAAVRLIGLSRGHKSLSSKFKASRVPIEDRPVLDELDSGLTEPTRPLYTNLGDATLQQRRPWAKPVPEEERT